MTKTLSNENCILLQAAERGLLTTLSRVHQQGADIDAQNSEGLTALMLAAKNGHLSVVQYLCQHKAKVNLSLSDGTTALHLAIESGKRQIVACLLANGADINAKRSNGINATHLAAEKNHLAILKLLHAYGAALDVPGLNASTPLMIAACCGHFDMVRYLCANGADVNKKNDYGWNPYLIAKHQKNVDIARLIKAYLRLEFNATDYPIKTPSQKIIPAVFKDYYANERDIIYHEKELLVYIMLCALSHATKKQLSTDALLYLIIPYLSERDMNVTAGQKLASVRLINERLTASTKKTKALETLRTALIHNPLVNNKVVVSKVEKIYPELTQGFFWGRTQRLLNTLKEKSSPELLKNCFKQLP